MTENKQKSGQKTRGFGRRRKKDFRDKIHERSEKIGGHFSQYFVGRISSVREVRLWVVEWALLILLVFLLSFVQILWYTQSHQTSAFNRGGNYSEASLGKVNSMNPLYASTDSEKILARLLFANLVSPDESGHEKAELAKSITMDETGKLWTLKLRENLKWSDGEAITADDVIYTIDLIRDTSAKTTVATDFSRIKAEKVDDLTVKFSLPSVYVDFIDILEFPLIPSHILKDVKPALVYENAFSMNPVGSGAFTLNTIQKGSGNDSYSQIVYLNRNDKYFKQNAKLDSFTLKVYSSTGDIITALKSGSVRATASLGRNSIEANNEISHRTSLLNAGVYAFINTQKITKTEVRQAIRQGVDIAKLREGLDESENLDYPFLKSQYEDLEYPDLLKYNLDEAKKKIVAAGYKYNEEGKITLDGKVATLRIAAPKRAQIEKSANALVEELKKFGFEINLNLVDESQSGVDFFTSVVRVRDYDILVYEVDLGVSADPFVYYSSTQASERGWNFSNYSNTLADDALLSARTTTSSKLRNAKYNAFLKYWANDVPAIGIYQSSLDYYYASNTEIFSENLHMTDACDRFEGVQYWASEMKRVEMTP